jgi:hypothetical protein
MLNDDVAGQGKFISNSTQVVYVGQWATGVKHGEGVLQVPTGDSFRGKWVNGQMDGPGYYQFNETSPWLDSEY